MKQILFTFLFLTVSVKIVFSCSCFVQNYCELKDEIAGNEKALVFKGFPIAVDTLADYIYAVQFEITKIYSGESITPESPLYGGEAYANTDSTVWLLAGSSAACFRYFENREAIFAVFYNEAWNPIDEFQVAYVPSICRGDYFPIADDGTVRGYIWSEYVEDVVPLEEFEQVIESRCIVSTNDKPIQDITIELFPQPACDYMNIKIESRLDFKISLHDIQGKVLSQVTSNQLDTSDLSPGVYLLSFEYGGERQIKKFVKM